MAFDLGATRTAPLTAQDLRKAMEVTHAREVERAKRVNERLRLFYDSIPAALHRNALVALMATLIETETPIHPKEAEHLQGRLDQLLQEYGAR